jgi:DNA-binding NtrC family response regulator
MVVDDDEDVALMVVTALGLAGFDAVSCTQEFEALFGPDPWLGVDVAVVDRYLGDRHDGADILRYLRDTHPGIRRLLYSGSNPVTTPGGLGLPGLCERIVLKGDINELVEAVRG